MINTSDEPDSIEHIELWNSHTLPIPRTLPDHDVDEVLIV